MCDTKCRKCAKREMGGVVVHVSVSGSRENVLTGMLVSVWIEEECLYVCAKYGVCADTTLHFYVKEKYKYD